MRVFGTRVELHGVPALVGDLGYLKERTASSSVGITPQITEQSGNKGETSVSEPYSTETIGQRVM